MNKASKLILCLLLAAMLAFSAGCALNTDGDGTDGSVIADGTTVLAKVGDHEILYQEFEALYNAYVSMYAMYGYDIESDESMKAEIQSVSLASLIQEQVMIYQAEQNGFTQLTDEQQAELDAQIEETLNDMDEYFRAQAENEAETDEDLDVEARIVELIEEEAEYYYPNQNLSADEYSEKIAESVRTSYCTALLQDHVYAQVSVEDAEVEEWYQDALATAKEEYAADASYYFEDQENYELYGGDPVTYAPEGYSRIMHILIAPEGAMSEDYSTKSDELEALVAEYGQLGIEQANGASNSARLAEIVTEYNALKAELLQMETDYYADAKAAVEAAYARLESGEAFADVMKECTQDSYFVNYSTLCEKGRLIASGDGEWSDLIHEQFSALAPGQYSAVFSDEEGYHIIYYVADEASGEIELSALKDDISAMLLSEKQSSEWNSCITEWMQDKSVSVESDTLGELGISYNY